LETHRALCQTFADSADADVKRAAGVLTYVAVHLPDLLSVAQEKLTDRGAWAWKTRTYSGLSLLFLRNAQ
jgi:hypothetical protein